MAFGKWKPFVFVFLLVLLSAQLAFAQITKIKGRVTDSQTGEGIPFAGVYFKDSKVGVYVLPTNEELMIAKETEDKVKSL